MGTNYYAVRDRAPDQPGDPELDRLHIGKSSAGWPFNFRAHERLGLVDWPSWRRNLSRPGIRIVNEYRDQLTVEGMDNKVVGARDRWQGANVQNGLERGWFFLTLDGDLCSHTDFI